jgi:hypothetical protein
MLHIYMLPLFISGSCANILNRTIIWFHLQNKTSLKGIGLTADAYQCQIVI